MRVRVFLGGASVGRPPGVAQTVYPVNRVVTDRIFQIPQLARCAAYLHRTVVLYGGDTSGVIPAIFEAAQTL